MVKGEKPGLFDAHMHSAHSSGFPLPAEKILLSCAASPRDWPALLSESRPEARIFLGLHPASLPAAHAELPPLLEQLSAHLYSAPRAGVGECGLDRRYYRSHDRKSQEEALRFQIRLAVSLARPLNLHQVRAAGALAEVLEEEQPGTPLIIHGFKEKKETAERFIRLGAFLSFAPGRHWEDESFLTLFRAIPRNRILLESDWPYTEDPGRSYMETMKAHYEAVSAVLGIDKEELCELVKRNGKVFTD